MIFGWYVFIFTLHIVLLFMHSSYHVYAHSGFPSAFITIFSDLNFWTFDDLDLLIATLSNLNLLAFSNHGLQLEAHIYALWFLVFVFLFSFFILCLCLCTLYIMFMHVQLFKCFLNSFQQSWFFKLVMVEEKDVCLVEFIDNVGKVEKNCGMPPTSIVHGSILDVENKHMQVVIHSFATTTNFVEVEVMQLMAIQVQAIAWKPHSQSLIS